MMNSDGRLPFLDLCIVHTSDEIYTTWYTKPTDTGLIMNFHSIAPRKYKRSVIEGLVHRIYRACSKWEAFHESMQRAKCILENNQYPPEFYDDVIARTLEKIVSHTDSTKTSLPSPDKNEGKTYLLSVQYRGRETDNLVRKLKKLPTPVKVILTLRKMNTVMPSLKAAVPMQMRSRVVYKITCPGCESSYVGQTVRHLRTRIAEHRNSKSVVGSHFKSCINSELTFDDVSVLCSTTRNDQFLLTLEAICIEEEKPNLNTREEWMSRILTLRF